MKKPSIAQRNLARTLGIDIPDGASMSEVSVLIDLEKTRRAQESAGTHGLPLESAFLVAQDTEPTMRASTGRVLSGIATRIREAGIKPGCVIRFEDSEQLYHVYAIDARKMRLVAVDLSRITQEISPTRFPTDELRIRLVSSPPEGFLPPACFIPQGDPLSKRQIERLIEAKRPGLNADDIVATEYGEVWRVR